MEEKLSKKGMSVIRQYLHLPLDTKTAVPCPYFKNTHISNGIRVLVGKGSPRDIADEITELAHKERVDIRSISKDKIRDFLIEKKIGIDCSGLVAQILFAIDSSSINKIHINRKKGSVFKNWITNRFRKIENISVMTLTSFDNSDIVDDMHKIIPGDLIRTRNGKHVLLVTRVKRNEGLVEEIEYVHSTSYYAPEHGVRVARINIKHPQRQLHEQEWTETDTNTGENYTLNGYLENTADSGIRRLKQNVIERDKLVQGI